MEVSFYYGGINLGMIVFGAIVGSATDEGGRTRVLHAEPPC